MYRPRVIPILLLRGQGFVKTQKFQKPTYLGDPINILRIFNEKEVDEIAVLDIEATRENRPPRFDLLETLANECFMPMCYGGGIRSLEEIRKILRIGFEKVAINSSLYHHPTLIREASRSFGSQSILASVDIKKNWLGKYQVAICSGTQIIKKDAVEWARQIEDLGAGEILLNSIDRDGMQQGYDHELIRSVSSAVNIPVVACGGAQGLADLARAVNESGASAAAAGSLFVFHGPHRAVLINYPTERELLDVFGIKL